MAFDGIVTCAVVAELSSALLQGKIEKIYQPDQYQLIFVVHTKSGKAKLFISCDTSHAAIHLTDENYENPAQPLPFCMLLRKHLSGGRIQSIRQNETERLVEIEILTIGELGFSVNKRLIVEIMGKHSNIILTDSESGKIIDSIKHVSIDVNRYRQILPGKVYCYPPAQNKIPFFDIRESDLAEVAAMEAPLRGKALLSMIQGFSPALADSVSAPEHQGADSADTLIWQRIQGLQQLLAQAIGAGSNSQEQGFNVPSIPGYVYLRPEDDAPAEFHIVPLRDFEVSCRRLDFTSISQAISYYFAHKSTSNRIKQRASDLEKAVQGLLDKLYLKKQRLSEDILKAQNSEEYRIYGELITANLHMVKAGADSVTLTNYYDGSQVDIPLDVRFSPAKNAQNYFKKYGKSKTAVKEKNMQLEETNMDIGYLESVLSFAENTSSVEETEALREELVENGYLRRRKNNFSTKKSKLKPLELTLPEGYRVLVGKNNKENDLLTLKTASSKDLWFHTKDIPGSHVILLTAGRSVEEIEDSVIYQTAAIAAYYSKARSSENVPVDYVPVKFVKKPAGAKPGMVIFKNNRTVWINPALPKE